MRCRKVKRKLSAFSDSEARERDRERINRHLETCRSCGDEVKTLSSLLILLKKDKENIKPSPYFWNKLEQKIEQAERNKSIFATLLERLNRILIPATATAVLIIGLFIGIHLGDVVYSDIAKNLESVSVSLVRQEVDSSLHLNMLDDFPGESIGGVYYALITESRLPQ